MPVSRVVSLLSLLSCLPGVIVCQLAGLILVAGSMHDPHEHLQADDGVDDDDK